MKFLMIFLLTKPKLVVDKSNSHAAWYLEFEGHTSHSFTMCRVVSSSYAMLIIMSTLGLKLPHKPVI